MKRIYLLSIAYIGILISSCENTPTALERITDKGVKVNIKSYNGKYLSSNWDEFIYADKDTASTWEEFSVQAIKDNKYTFKAYTNRFLSADLGSEQEIESNRDNFSLWESFELIEINDSTIAIKAANQKFVTINPSNNRLYAIADTISSNEHFILILKND